MNTQLRKSLLILFLSIVFFTSIIYFPNFLEIGAKKIANNLGYQLDIEIIDSKLQDPINHLIHIDFLEISTLKDDRFKLKAEDVLLKIKSGGNFIKLAKEYSEDEASYKEGGMLGHLHPDSTIPEIAAVMVKLEEGATSSIIESSFGYHILKLDEIIPSKLIPFDKAETDILNILMKRETQKLFEKYLIELEKNSKIEIFI